MKSLQARSKVILCSPPFEEALRQLLARPACPPLRVDEMKNKQKELDICIVIAKGIY